MASQNRTKKFKKITLWTFSFFSKICIAWKNQGINATRLRISKKNLVDRGRRKMANERHMTLRARSLCFPIILRVFDTTTCYVNTSTETRPIDLRRNGLLRGRVAAFRERERENSFYLATVQRIIDSRADFRLSTLRARLSPTYLDPTDFFFLPSSISSPL